MKKNSKYGRNPKLNPKTHCVMVRFDDVEWNKVLTMYEESQLYAKAVFLKAHFFGQKFKVLKVDKTLVDYYTKLSDFHAQFRAIGTNYNQVVRGAHPFFGEEGDGVALQVGKTYHRSCETEPGNCRTFKRNVCQMGTTERINSIVHLKNTVDTQPCEIMRNAENFIGSGISSSDIRNYMRKMEIDRKD